jgi:hypothetical protein
MTTTKKKKKKTRQKRKGRKDAERQTSPRNCPGE